MPIPFIFPVAGTLLTTGGTYFWPRKRTVVIKRRRFTMRMRSLLKFGALGIGAGAGAALLHLPVLGAAIGCPVGVFISEAWRKRREKQKPSSATTDKGS